MAKWDPKETIGKGERIGRRLFKKRQGLRGASDQRIPPNTFETYHFEDDRSDEISLDRLGQCSVEKRIRAYLLPRAEMAASRMTKREFDGWAVVQAVKFSTPPRGGERFDLIASPLAGDGSDFSENIYHAHAKRPSHLDYYSAALQLKAIFERDYQHEKVSQSATPVVNPSLLLRGARFFGWIAARVQSRAKR